MLNLYRNRTKGVDIIYTVYQHINKQNGKRYIGITKQRPKDRWGCGGVNYKNDTPRFWSAIQHYGWDNFEHLIVKDNLTRKDACELEIKLIKEYKTQDKEFGYNILEGGQSPKITEEVRKKMSKAMMGNQNGLGHPCSEEKKKKISDAQKGRKLTEEHKKKLSLAKKGKPHAPCSEETKRKISAKHKKKPVYCYETDKVYESIQNCAKELNIDATSVCAVCKGKHKTVKNYHLTYYDIINA